MTSKTSTQADRLQPPQISEHMVSAVVKRLEMDRPVRRRLPSNGHLHIDRQLPFLLIYRRPARGVDPGMEQLLRGESSYLIVDGHRRFNKGVVALVEGIAASLAESFGAFLLIEIWSARPPQFDDLSPPFRPAFAILTQRGDAQSSTLLAVKKALERIRVQRTGAQVELTESGKPWAPGMPRLMAPKLAQRLGCHHLGLAIRPVFRNLESGEEFPLIRRVLHRSLGRVFRRAAYAFTRDQTTQRPPHFHALGPRSLVSLVWDVDRELAEIADDFDFLLCVSPTNTNRAWTSFKSRRFEALPALSYRPLPVDPALIKRQLYRIPIEKIQDPALEALFYAQQSELDRKLTMLGDRNTRRFLYGSLQLYGRVEADLLEVARNILTGMPSRSRAGSPAKSLDAKAFAARAEEDIRHYREIDGRVSSRVEIREDVIGVMVSHGNLLINSRQRIAQNRVDALLAHEVGTHVLTYFNGLAQPFRQLYTGLPDYEELQEGVAVTAEYLAGGLTVPRLRILAGRVVAAHMIVEGADFIEVFRELDRGCGFTQQTAFNITLRIFRGGGLLKDMVYLRGLIRVLEYLGRGEAFEPLLVGKFGADHLAIMRELQWRKVISPPVLKPRYLESAAARQRLEALRRGVGILDLIKRI